MFENRKKEPWVSFLYMVEYTQPLGAKYTQKTVQSLAEAGPKYYERRPEE